MTFPIRLDTLGPGDCVEIDLKLFKAVTRQTVEPNISTGKKRSIGCFAKRHARIQRDPLFLTKWFKAITVKPENAVFGADPNKADAVLVDSADCEVVQALRDPKAPETVFLSA